MGKPTALAFGAEQRTGCGHIHAGRNAFWRHRPLVPQVPGLAPGQAERPSCETADAIPMNMKRMRGRNHRHGGGGGGGGGGGQFRQSGHQPMNRNHVFDSNGPDMRLRGTAQQLFEKYLQLGRDATSSGDRVMAEGYFQHAEHYFRILNAMSQAQQQREGQHQPRRFQSNAESGEAGEGQEAPGEMNGQVNGHALEGEPEYDGPQPETREPV
jgi:hypothetical protein